LGSDVCTVWFPVSRAMNDKLFIAAIGKPRVETKHAAISKPGKDVRRSARGTTVQVQPLLNVVYCESVMRVDTDACLQNPFYMALTQEPDIEGNIDPDAIQPVGDKHSDTIAFIQAVTNGYSSPTPVTYPDSTPIESTTAIKRSRQSIKSSQPGIKRSKLAAASSLTVSTDESKKQTKKKKKSRHVTEHGTIKKTTRFTATKKKKQAGAPSKKVIDTSIVDLTDMVDNMSLTSPKPLVSSISDIEDEKLPSVVGIPVSSDVCLQISSHDLSRVFFGFGSIVPISGVPVWLATDKDGGGVFTKSTIYAQVTVSSTGGVTYNTILLDGVTMKESDIRTKNPDGRITLKPGLVTLLTTIRPEKTTRFPSAFQRYANSRDVIRELPSDILNHGLIVTGQFMKSLMEAYKNGTGDPQINDATLNQGYYWLLVTASKLYQKQTVHGLVHVTNDSAKRTVSVVVLVKPTKIALTDKSLTPTLPSLTVSKLKLLLM
jgi:hypothetical protein